MSRTSEAIWCTTERPASARRRANSAKSCSRSNLKLDAIDAQQHNMGGVYSWKLWETSNVSSILDLIQILRVIGKFHIQGSRTMVCVRDICRRTSALECAPQSERIIPPSASGRTWWCHRPGESSQPLRLQKAEPATLLWKTRIFLDHACLRPVTYVQHTQRQSARQAVVRD